MLDHAGRRDKLVTIQGRPSDDAVEGGGFPVDTFTDLPPAEWMSKKALSATGRFAENVQANQIVARVDTEWQMLYRADMDPDRLDVQKLRRLVYNGRTYNITRAELMERHEGYGIRLLTSARSGTGA